MENTICYSRLLIWVHCGIMDELVEYGVLIDILTIIFSLRSCHAYDIPIC